MSQEMCCGGTCVRAACEYHRPVPYPTPQEKLASLRAKAKAVTRVASPCGNYVWVYRDGKLVDEVPA